MTSERLDALLRKSAADTLTSAEERELASLLEHDAGARAAAERSLGEIRHDLADLQAYRAALAPGGVTLPAAQLEALVARARSLPGLGAAEAKVVPFPGWRRVAAHGAIAACIAILVTFLPSTRRPHTQVASISPTRGLVEYGLVTSAARMRDIGPTQLPTVVEGWRVVPHLTQLDLRAWTAAPLPDGVDLRLWVDEEAGMIRAVYRRPVAAWFSRAETPINPQIPLREQLVELAAKLHREARQGPR